jgi:hypothetical protein
MHSARLSSPSLLQFPVSQVQNRQQGNLFRLLMQNPNLAVGSIWFGQERFHRGDQLRLIAGLVQHRTENVRIGATNASPVLHSSG